MEWKTSVLLGKYFGVISEEEADEWIDPDELPFDFEVDEEGRIWVIPKNQNIKKKTKPSN